MLTIIRSSVKRSLTRTFASSVAATKQLDPIQKALMDEKCFVVDDNDNIIGTASKLECHKVQKNGDIPLHRAFSVYLFNNRGDFLLQKRASVKITYPDHYSNTCCSHPVADYPGEEDGITGIKKAAQRRLNYELGIPIESIPLEKFEYINRIHYKDDGDGKWGEHEIAYMLILRGDLKLQPNPNEISEVSYIPRNELDQCMSSLKGPMTPWFRMILKYKLKSWWAHLDRLDEVRDHETILRFKN